MTMHTVADFATTGTLTFTQALAQAERLARAALPEALHERLGHALTLVKTGSVFQADDGTWHVASATTRDKNYAVNGSCSCEDAFYRAPEGRCKHKLAQFLARKVQALMTVAQTGAPEPVPEVSGANTKNQALGEAPASINVRLMIEGRDCQLTLRDMSETRLLERLQTILARYPVAQPAPQALSPGEGWCSKHGLQMTQNHKEGRSWWSHHHAGQWCKGK
jgi:hypothetical protein